MTSFKTTRYKVLMLALVGIVGVFVIGGTFYAQQSPYTKTQSFITTIKRITYSIAYAADATLSNNVPYSSTLASTSTISIPVLAYHGIISHEDGSLINLTEAQFKDQMFALKKAGYHTISIDELYAYATRHAALPKKPVVITFDDGRSDSFYNGDPILAALGFKANMFVITSFAENAKPGSYYLSPQELQMVEATGRWTIGSHSANGHSSYPIDGSGTQGHFFADHLWLAHKGRTETDAEFLARITGDFNSSHDYLANLLHAPVTGFAFPYGDFGQSIANDPSRATEVIRSASSVYDMLFYQYEPSQYFTQFTSNEYATGTALVHRIDVSNSVSGDELVRALEHGAQKRLPYSDDFAENNGWLSVWGMHTIDHDVLSMQAAPDQSGAGVILDGSQSWQDYTVHATMTSPHQTGVFLWTRFTGDDQYAGCNFGINFVHIEETINGKVHVLKGISMQNVIPAGSFTISSTVRGRSMSCSIDGKEVISTDFLDPSLTRGGTGIKIWDQTLGKSAVQLTNFSVDPAPAAL